MNDNVAEGLPDKNIFMMCTAPNPKAFTKLPLGYHIRHCRKDELDLWKAFPFDDAKEAKQYRQFMTDFFDAVYADKGELFFEKCLFVCDSEDQPIATGFIWRAYDEFNTLHWLKVLKGHEDKGLGRALLSALLGELKNQDLPVYLHTQPESYRAIKLYSDFGFKLLTDSIVGGRTNDLEVCLSFLQRDMKLEDFKSLEMGQAPAHFISQLSHVSDHQF